jgi:three-Cys-motif partner protein
MILDPNDGEVADEVGAWTAKKHECLRRYVHITSGVRRKFLGPHRAGCTFIDLFCGCGRARLRENHAWIDGSAAVAWLQSKGAKTPFTETIISDSNSTRRSICANRLRKMGAVVRELDGDAVSAAKLAVTTVDQEALHTAFIDPYTLRALDFRIIETLAKLKRIDMVIHISTMDLQRNLVENLSSEDSDFDYFCPGWRDHIKIAGSDEKLRADILEYWKSKIVLLGVWPSKTMRLVTGTYGQRLYWLAVASKHPLAHSFWEIASNIDKQGSLFEL